MIVVLGLTQMQEVATVRTVTKDCCCCCCAVYEGFKLKHWGYPLSASRHLLTLLPHVLSRMLVLLQLKLGDTVFPTPSLVEVLVSWNISGKSRGWSLFFGCPVLPAYHTTHYLGYLKPEKSKLLFTLLCFSSYQ